MRYKEESLENFIVRHVKGHPLFVAIEQREFVWDSRNVIQLLDSICRGIPMGTIILGGGDGLDEKRKLKKNPDFTIYDGQQRLMSLKKIFVKDVFDLPKDKLLTGNKCRVWVDIANFKKAIEPNGENKKCLLRFKYKGAEAGCYPFEVVPQSLLEGVKSEDQGKEIQNFVKGKRTFNASEEWVPLRDVFFLGQNGFEGKGEVGEFIRSQISKYKICICKVGHGKNLENLFLRINRAGKPVTDEEQYFAALKQRWPDAEQKLEGLWGEGTPFGLLEVVHMMVYMAHNITSDKEMNKRNEQGVYLRLQLREFNGSIVEEIKRLLEKKKYIAEAIKSSTKGLSNAGLKYGVNLINKRLMATAMASVISGLICEKEGPLPKGESESWKRLARYLFVIDQSGVLSGQAKDKHIREEFERLWKTPFPQRAQHESAFKDRLKTNWINEELWLSVFQGLPLDKDRGIFDIDHIIPYSWVKNKRRIKSELRKAVNTMGNKWLVESGKNREWQAEAPARKFDDVKKDPGILLGSDFQNMSISEERFKRFKNASDLADKEGADSLMSAIEERTRKIKEKVCDALDVE